MGSRGLGGRSLARRPLGSGALGPPPGRVVLCGRTLALITALGFEGDNLRIRERRPRALMRTLRILSIDGGGIRGIIPALLLAELEQRSGKHTAELFDLIAGTSTGGILATLLTKPGTGGNPQYAAAELIDFYLRKGPSIFSNSLWNEIMELGGAARPKYPASGVESVLKSYLGEAMLKDTVSNILVCAYEIQLRQPWFFRTIRARSAPEECDFPLWQVARCTSAALTYFSPERITSTNGKSWALVDGSTFANNPGICALAEAKAGDPGCDVLLVSLGTGDYVKPIQYQEARSWGLVAWARPGIDIVLDGLAKATDYQLQQLLPHVDDQPRYFRFQAPLLRASDRIDDTDPENLADLKTMGEVLIQTRKADLDQLLSQL
jgi:predicted acylesterase/phospholipase RssA